MPLKKLNAALEQNLKDLRESGRDKGAELVIKEIKKPKGEFGPRYILEGYGDKEFVKMNANSYLGMSMNPDVIEAEEAAAQKFGVGPGAVRFISGTHTPHIELEKKTVELANEAKAELKGKGMVVQEYLIDYLLTDEEKHNQVLENLSTIKKGMYPYG